MCILYIAYTHVSPLGLLWSSVFITWPHDALCDHLSIPNFQSWPFFTFQDTPVGQARGWDTSAASSMWLTGILPWWRWKLLWYPKWKRYLDQHTGCLQWSDIAGYVHWMLCPAWVVQELVAQQMPLWTHCWSVPNPCLPPIWTKLNLESLMALAVAFPHCWNVQPLIKDQSLRRLSSDCLWSYASPLSVACVSFPVVLAGHSSDIAPLLIDASCMAPW